MKEYQVSYCIGNMYHAYLIDAENEAAAYEKVLRTMPPASKAALHDLRIKRHFAEWN